MLRLCYNGQRKYKSFGLYSSEKMWNEKKEEVRSTHPYAKSMNTLIRAEVDKANKRIMELERDKKMLMSIRKLRNIMRLTLLVPRLISPFVSLLSR